MKGKLSIACMLSVCFSASAANSVHWGYEGNDDPAHWGKLSPDFSLCETGKNQSPVNIRQALNTQHEPLQLAFQSGTQQIINNGHTVQVNVSAGNTLLLDNETFTLQQFHFHAPSENEIDGKQFPLEGHFVYKNADGALTVIAVMFQEGAVNPQLVIAWQQIPTRVDHAEDVRTPVAIQSLLPTSLNYYRFSGSLTTPPCSEGIRWLVLENPVTASAEQISQFSSVMHHANNRPIQPLNGRIIIH
ncbi:carbonic anhydrase [Pectobacterium zantedeschiae]|uniref:Carbonic anhydrase n=1 Tax=Pectobacterium zantedeschiae TaxID=2034769 RepID=A0A9X8P718_9GAMM|nr:carbonic anhydrase [Pectobacterium zantedeschiae]RYC37648.1 carbonic anhydrase [Pectobacterium zantedeschiae]RYC46136.1 carbonic anhydrase [Pectobacterium zantedeschiae]